MQIGILAALAPLLWMLGTLAWWAWCDRHRDRYRGIPRHELPYFNL